MAAPASRIVGRIMDFPYAPNIVHEDYDFPAPMN